MTLEAEAPVRAAAAAPPLPQRVLPRAPSAGRVWSRALVLASVLLGVWLLDQLANLLMEFWLLESLGYEDVFWTNFEIEAVLFAIATVAVTAAVALPAVVERASRRARRRAIGVGLMAGILLGLALAGGYRDYLLFLNGRSFGREDPVYGNDIGFYVFDLPAIKDTLHALEVLLLIALAAAITFALLRSRAASRPPGMGAVRHVVGRAASPLTIGYLVALDLVVAADIWLRRYDLLLKDNTESSIPSGAQALDVSGFFSTKNLLTVEAIAILIGVVGGTLVLVALRRGVMRPGDTRWRAGASRRRVALALLPGLALTVLFQGGVALREDVEIRPNEPVVQLPYIKRHIDATNTAYGMNDVESRRFVPNGPNDPKPNLGRIMRSPTIRNAPLWPGYHSRLERQVDPEYVDRILAQPEDFTIYGPTMNTYQQQQKLRPYYDFMDVDTVRYRVNGEPTIFASAVRELPLVEPQPWLAWWGQRFVVFTHGQGLVMNPVGAQTPAGTPQYGSRDIPAQTTSPELAARNGAIYYGEGAGSMAYSNVARIQEHDIPTDTGRRQVSYPQDVRAGVEMDSTLKRVVFGWKSRQFLEIFFSDLVEEKTRVHYFRTPLERIEHVAPFLYSDTDPYAVTGGDRINWMINALTTTNRYPYSAFGDLGDKSDRRTATPRDPRRVNYAADTVKATVDAFTGQINLYKWRDEPVIDTWQDIYPDLFKDKATMPARLRDQVQYPVQLMHLQFDDLYIYSHMKDPLTFFSQEDLFDDGDEVVGALDLEGEAVNFSIEPYYWMAETGRTMPPSSQPTQFAMSTVFTPENALNLRAIITAYQEGDDYGKLSMLEVPKGRFVPGPEQADSAIDQDPFISQQIGLWSRRGLEVTRGHTTPLVIDRELIYVEPLFVRSKQNPLPQLERVVVVFRGRAFMGRNLREALETAIKGESTFPIRPGPELGGEPRFNEKGELVTPDGRTRPGT